MNPGDHPSDEVLSPGPRRNRDHPCEPVLGRRHTNRSSRGIRMARIAGVDLPRNKQARIALTYIFGIGNPRALKILEKANVDAFKKIQDLGEEEVNRIRQVIEDEGNIEGDLRKDVSMHIKRLMDIQSYRGNRHRRSLPERGQRTHTNARTRKGPRKGTVAGKKKAVAKT